MAENGEKMKHLGADLEEAFVLKFRSHCLENDFKQKTLVFRLVEWWMGLDQTTQEHIYRGRVSEAHSQIAEEARGRAVISRAKAQTERPKQKRIEKPSKTG